MNKKLVLVYVKKLERVIESISHTLSGDEFEDIIFFLNEIKSEIKKYKTSKM